MKVAVLGAGFGLYGYLPALLLCGQRVVLPERYRARLVVRPDIGRFEDGVDWARDDEDALAAADAVVVTRRPIDQAALVPRLGGTNLRRVLLEKPLAPDPTSARLVMQKVRQDRLLLRIGYLFRYTSWAERLREEVTKGGVGEITLHWRFRAHHHLHKQATWKRSVEAGGGALRFYGIHLIALLAEMGYTEVQSSICRTRCVDEADSWRARFGGKGLPNISVEVDTDCGPPSFLIIASERAEAVCTLPHPFHDVGHGEAGLDGRVGVLLPLCRDLVGLDAPAPSWYDATVDLWEAVEKVNAFHESR